MLEAEVEGAAVELVTEAGVWTLELAEAVGRSTPSNTCFAVS